MGANGHYARIASVCYGSSHKDSAGEWVIVIQRVLTNPMSIKIAAKDAVNHQVPTE
jgi:multisubunit Na+/H+ antiporter MnhG subunit